MQQFARRKTMTQQVQLTKKSAGKDFHEKKNSFTWKQVSV